MILLKSSKPSIQVQVDEHGRRRFYQESPRQISGPYDHAKSKKHQKTNRP